MSTFASPSVARSIRAIDEARLARRKHGVILERTRALVQRLSLQCAELREARERALRLVAMGANLNGIRSEQGITAGATGSEPPTHEAFVDLEVMEDRELISALNLEGFRCDGCGHDEPLVAVIRFVVDGSKALGICGDCYRELAAMSRGEVIA